MAFAQHHGGEQAPPISFGDGQVTVSTSIFPMDFIPDESSSVDLRIRFYDAYSNMNIESTTYRVQIFSGTDLVANQMFFDKDGHLDIKIQPNSNCENDVLWKCTKYHGEQDPIVPNALTSSASSKPVIIGPVFDKSGDYTVKTSIIGAKNPKTQTEKDIVFETKITIPSKQQFPITFNGVEYPVIIKNFETSLNDFNFDESSNSFVFQIPYNWSHLDQTDTIKSYFEFPKNFPPFENVYGFVGKANHDVVLEGSIHYDEYSKKDNNIIHFIIDQNHLKEIDKDSQQIKIAISPLPTSSTVKEELIFDNGFKAIFVYDSNIKNNSEFGFHIVFFDQDNNLASNVRYVYGLKNPSENEIMNVG
ncbi:MAG: peptidase, partial [Nitrosopumilus sp.]|nr:peptidase [Nitrosopumilus sp.]